LEGFLDELPLAVMLKKPNLINNLKTNLIMKSKILILIISLLLSNISICQEKSRSAKTGRYVTKDYAKKHKSTTYTSKTKSKR